MEMPEQPQRTRAAFPNTRPSASPASAEWELAAGRTVYRIRPISTDPPSPTPSSFASHEPSQHPFARPSHQPHQHALTAIPGAHPATGPHQSLALRQSRSIPLLRAAATPTGLLRPPSATPSPPEPGSMPCPSPRLRKAPSSPSFSAGARASAPGAGTVRATSRTRTDATRSNSCAGEGDVLGRILGWRADLALPARAGGMAARTRTRAEDAGAPARVGLPAMLRRPGKGSTKALEGDAVSEAGTDRSDLPEDLLEELDAASVFDEDPPASPSSSIDHPFAAPKQRPSYQRRPPGPFGTGVRIKSSTRPAFTVPASAPLPSSSPAHAMREVNSSDSIRTARAGDQPPLSAPERVEEAPASRRFEDPSIFDVFHRPPVVPLPGVTFGGASQIVPIGEHGRLPSSTSLASTHSGRSEASHASAHDIAVVPAPGDDARFVIWGVKDPVAAPAAVAASRSAIVSTASGPTGKKQHSPAPSTASPGTASSRRWSVGGRSSATSARDSSPATSVRDSVGSATAEGPAQRLLMGATVERLVAELTSQIAPDLLSDFFLTFRHYVAPLSLLHLLIARFEWAMQPASSAEDDALRRVVRVRTFVVVRYWLLNHFMVDFYPSRALRTALTTWLNAAARDERFRANPRDMRLVKALKKTARRCKDTYILGATIPAAAAAAAGEGDLDLDLGVGAGTIGFDTLLPPAAASTAVAPAPAPTPQSSGFASLRAHGSHLEQSAMLDSIAAAASAAPLATAGAGGLAPGPGLGPIARSFTSALGTLGRLKRRLRERAAHPASSPAAAGAIWGERGLELERRGETDLLLVRGGVEEYLRYWGIELPEVLPERERTPELERAGDTPESWEETDDGEDAVTPRPDVVLDLAIDSVLDGGAEAVLPNEGIGLGIVGAREAEAPPAVTIVDHAVSRKLGAADMPSSVTAPEPYAFSLAPGAFAAFPSSTASDRPHSVRIELDDLDDSDDDVDDDVIEAKRTLKRLPAAVNLRLAAAGCSPRRSASGELGASPYAVGHVGTAFDWVDGDDMPRDSVIFLDDDAGDAAEGVAIIPNFVLDGLVDSEEDDEPGDVEAALRRLEGLVDKRRESEKKRRVERQMEKSSRLDEERRGALERLEKEAEALDCEWAHARRMSLASTPEEPDDQPAPAAEHAATISPAQGGPVSAPLLADSDRPGIGEGLTASRPPAPPRPVAPPPPQTPPQPTRHGILAVPLSPPTFPSIGRILSAVPRPLSTRPGIPAAPAPRPPSHRSFVLYFRTEVLAAQFTLIERDMLRMVSYQELVSGSWRDRIGADGETNVLDWEAYVKERRMRNLQAKERGEQTKSAVQDVIARFNLTANWVCSEILLTADLNERALLIAKFIRLAFKCYCQANLLTLAQIVHGLQIQDVERLHQTWARVPSWEMRKLRGMQVLVSHLKNFKHLRELMNAMLADYGAIDEYGSMADATFSSASTAKGCIPFLGLFLRDLALNTELPTFLDPSSPYEPANVDSIGSLTSLADPTAFASFPPLPPGTHLAPLVNVHKFRVLAAVVQRVVAFQHLATRYTHEPQPETYLRCLKIRSLEQGIMHQLSMRLEA
ncbi:hypothetical protein JCM3770_005102 [Rhodotorula araucariae]